MFYGGHNIGICSLYSNSGCTEHHMCSIYCISLPHPSQSLSIEAIIFMISYDLFPFPPFFIILVRFLYGQPDIFVSDIHHFLS